jgi:3-oxosteroid 1-dehydrogenase
MTDAGTPWWVQDFLMRPIAERPSQTDISAREEWDVLVVGSGMAGLSAALFLRDAGCSVAILEAAGDGGGTTWKSGGGIWIPDNHVMHALGFSDDRESVLRLMSRLGYPESFEEDAERYGLPEWEWSRLCAFYDHAGAALKALVDGGALRVHAFRSFTERYPAMVPYHFDDDESIQAFYRHVVAEAPDGGSGSGHELVRQLSEATASRGIETRMRHRVCGLVVDEEQRVVGVEADTPNGRSTLRARHGVVFASGGFAHSEELVAEHLQAPLYSSCAVSTARGDFLKLVADHDASLAQMDNAWFHQDLLEKVAAGGRESQEGGLNVPAGDSMLIVDVAAKRVGDEKAMYHERGKLHFERHKDGSFPNRVLVMVYDERAVHETRTSLCLDTFVPPKPWIATGQTIEDLAADLDGRLRQLEGLTDGLRLADDFGSALGHTIDRFNQFAKSGVDEDFGRGAILAATDWSGGPLVDDEPRRVMRPLAASGPYFAVLLCGHILDTNGGPRTDVHGRVLRNDGSVVDGLYGAGNCVASAAGSAYVSGGITLGVALASAWAAATHLVAQQGAAGAGTADSISTR